MNQTTQYASRKIFLIPATQKAKIQRIMVCS
jgi:hypothetical protein